MMLFQLENLRFTFWNCGLTPPKGRNKALGSGYVDFQIVCDYLIACSDVIGLAEVGSDNLENIELYAETKGWETLSLLKKTDNGGSYFDHMLLYNPSKVDARFVDTIIASVGTSNIKAAIHTAISTKTHSPTTFDLFISHWPSRLQGKKDEREFAANSLKQYIDNLPSKKNVICMGDYNDSPFSKSININLHSSKCYDAINSRPEHTLYNPFWKLSVSQDQYTYYKDIKSCKSVGTYRFKGNSVDHLNWYSFDQILVSGSFLGFSQWHLDEPSTKIIDERRILTLFNNSSSYVDHLPVTLHIVHP
ncbi:hypothetical protein KIN38_00080 [Vibrio sp. B511a]|uniref:endonuclease/exonuclease/phosphatase family protein n=1 Tax=unclassified Vibrio TaxID=2614977 RepID=UPI0023EE0240|nr:MULTISPECIES: hypothetical protein [unclassified Vibrio]EJL6727415.1 hypothetical protein [Vibrio alginolyticus]MDK9731124.1 hypothetical protein [Vibrio sp. B511a]MDW2093774.1 hypothetical protein [Vibrio sp. 1866]MDW3103469.1 hypothetical protein [Vibrio sp. 1874]MDW3201522.1 hypothetical protein [Vibrio sp. 1865]